MSEAASFSACSERVIEMPGVKYWNEFATKRLVGRTIVKAVYEDVFGDGVLGITFTLDDGTVVIASQDDEGNGPGALFLEGKEKDSVLPVIRED